MWALGCIFAELLALKPIFKGEEVKMDNKKSVPFQRGQMQKIIEILGTPTRKYSLIMNSLCRRQMAYSPPSSRIYSPHVIQAIHQQSQEMVFRKQWEIGSRA
jgi:cyclin-dependent kinase 8/11